MKFRATLAFLLICLTLIDLSYGWGRRRRRWVRVRVRRVGRIARRAIRRHGKRMLKRYLKCKLPGLGDNTRPVPENNFEEDMSKSIFDHDFLPHPAETEDENPQFLSIPDQKEDLRRWNDFVSEMIEDSPADDAERE